MSLGSGWGSLKAFATKTGLTASQSIAVAVHHPGANARIPNTATSSPAIARVTGGTLKAGGSGDLRAVGGSSLPGGRG